VKLSSTFDAAKQARIRRTRAHASTPRDQRRNAQHAGQHTAEHDSTITILQTIIQQILETQDTTTRELMLTLRAASERAGAACVRVRAWRVCASEL